MIVIITYSKLSIPNLKFKMLWNLKLFECLGFRAFDFRFSDERYPTSKIYTKFQNRNISNNIIQINLFFFYKVKQKPTEFETLLVCSISDKEHSTCIIFAHAYPKGEFRK